ncbi:hypothetical protein CEXT_85111 [Caerostris extrusa]|uniref:Uncharacterized protein n=1 Tax=Caerostris extrusa TaxID=172846 RepID=A0AAV4XYL8_CAEEX|nr:hypothetical protein CEXT_85111 [Caerostris extrusa]
MVVLLCSKQIQAVVVVVYPEKKRKEIYLEGGKYLQHNASKYNQITASDTTGVRDFIIQVVKPQLKFCNIKLSSSSSDKKIVFGNYKGHKICRIVYFLT